SGRRAGRAWRALRRRYGLSPRPTRQAIQKRAPRLEALPSKGYRGCDRMLAAAHLVEAAVITSASLWHRRGFSIASRDHCHPGLSATGASPILALPPTPEALPRLSFAAGLFPCRPYEGGPAIRNTKSTMKPTMTTRPAP